jgi:3-hydroxyacyl-[acyl-carrier-protein] dehydratase
LLLGKADIQQILPHREPFVLVDGVIELDPGRYGVGIVRDVARWDLFSRLRERKSDSNELMLVDSVRPSISSPGVVGIIENVATLEPLFEGHFPGQPVFPGALTLAAMAEVAHHYLLQKEVFCRGAFLKRADGWRFRRAIVPGDRLEIHAEETDPTAMKVTATIEGRIAAEGRLTFVPGDPVVASPLPGQATLPGALVVEALAEVGAVAVLGQGGGTDRLALLVAIQDWEFYAPVLAGMEITLSASLVDMRPSFGKGLFVASSADGPVAEGHLVFGFG